jgi:hypothetical protein
MSDSNAEKEFDNQWEIYSSALDKGEDPLGGIYTYNLEHKKYKPLFDKYEKRRFIYEQLLKQKETLHSKQIYNVPAWLCEGIEQSLFISQSSRDSKTLSERIEAHESLEKAYRALQENNDRVVRLMGEQKIGRPLRTVSNELEYFAEIAARTLKSLKDERNYLKMFGQSGRDTREIIRFGKSLSLYLYESIGMKLNGTVAHIINAIFSLPNENYGELRDRDSVREWTKELNWIEQDSKM